jgi:hypothetical protein
VLVGAVYVTEFPVPEIVPPLAVQVTAMLLVLLTVAVNVAVAFGASDTPVGLIFTEIDAGAETVTLAEAFFDVSAALVAVTVYVPAVPGAVYKPEFDTVPPVAVQVTAVFELPVTVALNCFVAPVWIDAEVGLMETTTGGAAVVTVTVADADTLVSATLVAVTVYEPAVVGAVYKPEAEMLPPLANQVTAVLLLPVIDVLNCCVLPTCTAAEIGVIDNVIAGAVVVTVTAADADFVESAALVAVTV